jgi:hypothetical protein
MSTALIAPIPRQDSLDQDAFFAPQVTSSTHLPDPQQLIETLARCTLEIISGSRDLEQIARYVTDDVYRHLLQRVHVSQRARTITKRPVTRPNFALGRTIITKPVDGVVEAVVIVHGRARTRSIALRLEGIDRRWRATAINVL